MFRYLSLATVITVSVCLASCTFLCRGKTAHCHAGADIVLDRLLDVIGSTIHEKYNSPLSKASPASNQLTQCHKHQTEKCLNTSYADLSLNLELGSHCLIPLSQHTPKHTKNNILHSVKPNSGTTGESHLVENPSQYLVTLSHAHNHAINFCNTNKAHNPNQHRVKPKSAHVKSTATKPTNPSCVMPTTKIASTEAACVKPSTHILKMPDTTATNAAHAKLPSSGQVEIGR